MLLINSKCYNFLRTILYCHFKSTKIPVYKTPELSHYKTYLLQHVNAQSTSRTDVLENVILDGVVIKRVYLRLSHVHVFLLLCSCCTRRVVHTVLSGDVKTRRHTVLCSGHLLVLALHRQSDVIRK